MRPSFSLAELLPHRPPMILLDELVDVNIEARSIVVAFSARERWTGNWAAIEYMAQAAAALVGVFDRNRGEERPARPGFLLGTRHLALAKRRFEIGERYIVKAKCMFEDANVAAFECEITDGAGGIVAKATLNAFRPDDLAAFLTEIGG